MIGQQRLATLTRSLVSMVEGGEEEAARVVRVSRALLKKACSPNDPYSLSVADAHALEAHVGEPVVSRELAERLDLPDGGCLLSAGVSLVQEAANLPGAVLEALADGEISPAELTRIRAERDQVRRWLDQVDAAVAAVERKHRAGRPARGRAA